VFEKHLNLCLIAKVVELSWDQLL